MPIVTFVTLIHHDHSLGLGLFPMHEAFGPIVRQLRHSAMREPLLCIQNGTYIYHNPHIGKKVFYAGRRSCGCFTYRTSHQPCSCQNPFSAKFRSLASFLAEFGELCGTKWTQNRSVPITYHVYPSVVFNLTYEIVHVLCATCDVVWDCAGDQIGGGSGSLTSKRRRRRACPKGRGQISMNRNSVLRTDIFRISVQYLNE